MIKKSLWAAIPFLIFVGLFVLNMLRYRNGEQGAQLYKTHCQNCHLEKGQGLRGIIPPLSKADFLKNNQEQIACIIQNGIKGKIIVNGKKYNKKMPSNPQLKDTEIANIINYINTHWDNDIPKRPLQQVRIDLSHCP